VLRDAVRTTRGRVGLALTLLVLLVAFVGPFLMPNDPEAYLTLPFGKPSALFHLGGDNLGRDVFSRLLGGGWQLVLMAAAATAIGIGLGALAGVYAGYRRGLPDTLVMRAVDVLLAFPQLVFVLLLVSVVGASDWLLVVAVGLSHAPQVARVMRASTLDVSERDYVKAVEITGVSTSKIMTGEILPNLITPLMVEVGLRMTYSIVIMAGLSFIGFGLPPPLPNWGTMINENRIGLTLNPWAALSPAVMIAVLTIGLNTFTDAITRVALGVDRKEAAAAATAPGGVAA
jgi:peptide/nickel transport system permease protein